LEGLLTGLMMESGNDAAAAIAEHIAGSEPEFVRLMNARAKSLGAWATIFANPHGLDPWDRDHLTTAFDLALIARRGLQIPKFRELVRTRAATVESLPAMTRVLRNTNRLLWYFGGADGVKTGTTDYAGNCLVASATRDGWQLLAVVLGSQDRWRDAAALLEAGYREYTPMLAAAKGYPVGTAKVRWGMRREVPVAPARDVTAIIRNDSWDAVSAKPETRILSAPVASGEPAGKYRVFEGDHELTSVDLVAAAGTPRRTVWRTICAGVLALWSFVAGGEQ
jgi:D-alanyl-D-alanine carboxypeptidase (penicillin-binding protein 5/6)